MRKITILWLLALITGFSAHAQQAEPEQQQESAETTQPTPEVKEQKYVTDKLRLSLYEERDAKSKVKKLLISGDLLDIFEISGAYARVRTSNGDVGWVKNGFLVSTPPATYQLNEEQKKNQILADQLNKYSNTRKLVEDYENTIERMADDQNNIDSELKQAREQLKSLVSENNELQQQIADSQEQKLSLADVKYLFMTYWYVIIILAGLILAAGLLSGMKLVETQVRRKFHGIKVW